MMFNIDDRVYYISNSYGSSKGNPLKGGENECQGTVYHADVDTCRVHWDNGCSNGYLYDDLELVCQLSQTDPNIQWAKHKSRRR